MAAREGEPYGPQDETSPTPQSPRDSVPRRPKTVKGHERHILIGKLSLVP
jgi:hypothetical protein